jgi:hypothetical protein
MAANIGWASKLTMAANIGWPFKLTMAQTARQQVPLLPDLPKITALKCNHFMMVPTLSHLVT